MADAQDERYWIGFDLGGTKMLAKVFDGKFKTVGQKRRRTKAGSGEEVGLERVVGTITKALESAKIGADHVGGIGIGVPGPLDLERGVLLESPNLGWKETPLKKAIGKAFGCPVVVANDVDAGVYGEYRFGAGKGGRCVLGVFPGTGVGGGCVYEGKIIRGKVGSCLEIGHCQVMPDGALCGCGRRGCLETVASRLAISSAAAVAAMRGDAPNLAAQAGTDLSNIRSGVLAAAIAAGDRIVERIVRDAARWLGVAIGNAVNLLAPDIIVLGGGLVEAMPDLFLKEVRLSVRDNVLSSFQGGYVIEVAKLGDDASAMGAAALCRDTVGVKAKG